MTVSTNNGLVNGPIHNLLMQLLTPASSKIKVFETCFSDIATTQNDHPRYLKHVLGRIYDFLTLFGYHIRGGGGGLPRDWYTTCSYIFSPRAAQKIEVFETCFFDIVTTQYDHPKYVKHLLGRIYVFFTLFVYGRKGGGGAPKNWYTTC